MIEKSLYFTLVSLKLWKVRHHIGSLFYLSVFLSTFETGFHSAVLAGMELAMQTRLALNSSDLLALPSECLD